MDRQASRSESDEVLSIVERFERPLIRYAARLTGSAETARDVVQDVFIQLVRHDLAPLDGRLAPWLFTVCRNKALDLRRKDSRMSIVADDKLTNAPGTAFGPAELLERTERKDAVAHMLTRLPRAQEEVIRLRFQGGLSYRDIADVLDLSVSNVGYLMHMGIRTLRKWVGKESDGGEQSA